MQFLFENENSCGTGNGTDFSKKLSKSEISVLIGNGTEKFRDSGTVKYRYFPGNRFRESLSRTYTILPNPSRKLRGK